MGILLWILGVLTIGLFILCSWLRVGVTESLSASWYVLAHPKWFSVCVCLTAALEGMALWSCGAESIEMVAGSVMCLGLFGVGLVPQFRGVDKRSHEALALISAAGCAVLAWVISPYLFIVPTLVFCLGTVDDEGKWMWWLEVAGMLLGAICVGLEVCL